MTLREETYVCDCGAEFPIYRKGGNLRGKGHIKHLWCYKCKETKPFILKEKSEE